MKKANIDGKGRPGTLLLALLLLCLAPLLAGCQSAAVPTSEAEAIPVDVEVREKMFIAQTNDIYTNPDEYLGKTIKLEGLFLKGVYAPTGDDFYMVMRYGPGCCGNDDMAGFEVTWDADRIKIFAENDWVEAIGVLEEYEDAGNTFLRLNLKGMNKLLQRGAETVMQ